MVVQAYIFIIKEKRALILKNKTNISLTQRALFSFFSFLLFLNTRIELSQSNANFIETCKRVKKGANIFAKKINLQNIFQRVYI